MKKGGSHELVTTCPCIKIELEFRTDGFCGGSVGKRFNGLGRHKDQKFDKTQQIL